MQTFENHHSLRFVRSISGNDAEEKIIVLAILVPGFPVQAFWCSVCPGVLAAFADEAAPGKPNACPIALSQRAAPPDPSKTSILAGRAFPERP